MKQLIKKREPNVYLIPETVEEHTFTTYSIANEAFMQQYFPGSVYGFKPNKNLKNIKRRGSK